MSCSGTFAWGAAAPRRVYRYLTVRSVLDTARERVRENTLALWDSVLAVRQTCGRGQYHRPWASPEGNLYAALRLPQRPPFSGLEAAPATGAIWAATLAALGVDIRLKWPNDLMVVKGGVWHKAGGILLEEAGDVLLAGVGINLVSAPPADALRVDAAAPAACLWEIVPHFTKIFSISSPEVLWKRLVDGVYFWYTTDKSPGKDWKALAEARLLWRGERVCWRDGAQTLTGELVGLGSSGGARLLLPDGRVKEVLSGSFSPASS